jgi:hypothetical protein
MLRGLLVRDLAAPANVLASHRGTGVAPAEVLISKTDPDVMLSGLDSAGAIYAGMLEISDPGSIAPIAGTSSLGSFGLWFDAHWLDANPQREWFVGSGGDSWRLHRFDAAQPSLGHYWDVPSPDDPEPGFNNGRNYFLSWLDGDLLLLTRGGTRWGLVGYSRAALLAEAAIRPPGSTLLTQPLWQLETHFGPELANGLTWRCRTFELPTGQRLAAIAACYHTAPGPDATRPQVVLYDISAGTSAPPTLVASILGPNLEGNAIAVAPLQVGATTYLFVADFGYGLHVYDVSVPALPVRVGGWAAPTNIFDGRIDHPSDIEIVEDRSSGVRSAYVTLWRRGLVRLDVSNPASFSLPVLAERDTPGLPYGIALRDAYGAQGLVLADHQAGLRLYGQYGRWQPFGVGCAGAGAVPVLALANVPAFGGTFALSVSGLTGGLALMITGFGATSVPLAAIGLGFGANCTLLAMPDALAFLPQAAGTAAWSLSIPAAPSLVGLHLFNQVAELGPSSGVSNAGDGEIR